ncbi:class I SAM-dependent methyltransferase [bacterium]|nr:class I SAM-dependent methyltransferase [bacterium]
MTLISDYYTNKGGDYKPSNARVKRILDLLGDVKGKKILDIGCSQGVFGKILKDRGAIVVGCDISAKHIEVAQNVLDKAFVFDIENDDFSIFDKDFDFIIASELIEHLFLPKKFLSNTKSIMSDNTKLIITTPNFLMWSNRIKMLFGKFEYTKTGFMDEGHIHFFTHNSLKKAVKKIDMRAEAVNNIIHPKIPSLIGKLNYNLFSFQVIFKISK